MSTIGHNSQASPEEQRRSDDQRRYDLNVIAISAWVGERRLKEALEAKELGNLTGFDRVAALRQATIDNVHQFYRTNPTADVAPGVLVLIATFSDNNEGCCSISMSRIAHFLSRSRRAVVDAVARLEEQGCIKVKSGKEEGVTSRIWPVVNPVYANHRDPITWTLDAHAPYGARTSSSKGGVKAASQGGEKQGSQGPKGVKTASQVIKFSTKSTDAEGGVKAASQGGGVNPAAQGGVKAASHNITSIALDSSLRDSPLTPELEERGVWGESVFLNDQLTSPTAPPQKIAHTTETGAQKAKPVAVKFDLQPIEVVEVEVLGPGEGFGSARAKPAKVDGDAAAADRKKPKRPFPQSDDDVKHLWAYCLEYGKQNGMDDSTVRAEARHWSDWAKSKDERKADWQAAWRTWVSNWRKRKYQPASTGYAPSRSQTIDDAMDIALGKMRTDE